MAHSLTDILQEPVEDYTGDTTFETFPGCFYRVQVSEGIVLHGETLRDVDAQVIYEETRPVEFAVGSGKRGRSYLLNREGLLFMSPVTWYTEGHRFDLSPGYAPASHPRFSRRASDGCLACHAGLMATDDSGPHRYSANPFREESIGCERCHGPGREHIDFHSVPRTEKSFATAPEKDPIVNPANLSPILRDDICNQCHLQGVERILRYGRSEFDFRPGDRLSDIWATFVRGDRIDPSGSSTRAVSQVEQMHASECYLKSNGQLTCTSCHDPHQSPAPEQRLAFYRTSCLNCHDRDSTPPCAAPLASRREFHDSCIDCHMPRLDASDVPHTSQTDHRILRRGSVSSSRGTSPTFETEPQLFQNAAAELPPLALQRARGLLYARTARNDRNRSLALQALRMLEPLTADFPDDEILLDALGEVSFLVSAHADAERYWLQVLKLLPASESALEGLLLVCREASRHAAALEYANRFLEVNRWREDIYYHKSQILGELSRYEESIESAESGLEFNPGSVPLHRWLVEVCRRSGQTERAERYAQRLEKLVRTIPSQSP